MKKQRRYPLKMNMREAGHPEVRYAIEWRMDVVAHMVGRARFQKGGKASFGPITVYVHPQDRKEN